jgi:serine phosphatase RsbU (regulator of sigma subunit)/anti-sigma regulatory factor (Ser/Thr protein kinase)
VISAVDGLEAWHHLQQPDAPQIAVLDWVMPGLNGPEICLRLRARTPRPVVHLLLLTGKSDPEDIILGLQAGADDFLRKPFNPSELKARLEVGHRAVQLQNELIKNINDTRRLLAEQQLNLDQARKLLTIANGGVPRWLPINDELTLHLAHYSASSQRAGGDHCWARTLPGRGARGAVTLVGLRDQSGHEVNCILRSIATDLLHQEILHQGLRLEDQLGHLNTRLCASGMFAEDDFLTGLTLELDHASLKLRYVSCGHPPMFLIRQTQVIALPEADGPGRNLPLGSLADMAFAAGQYQLLPGDRLVLFTDGLRELGAAPRGTVLSIEEVRRIIEGLVQQSPGLPVRQLVRHLLDAVNGALGNSSAVPPPDDVTVLGVELEADAGPHELRFYPAGIQALDQAIQQTYHQLLSEWRIQPGSPQRLRLFLDEALTNAWRHGNRQNPRLPIHVRWGQHNGYSIVVEDAGSGFDPARLPDPRSPAGLLHEAGRGVYLIRNSCEWAEWKKGGTRLVARLACP